MKEKATCPHCDAKMVEYKHSFSNALAIGLWRLYLANADVNIKNLQLTRNQWDNFQKLRYWGLVAPAYRTAGTRLNGVWKITDLGKAFVEKATSIQKSVWTYRGQPVRFEGDTVFFLDVHDTAYAKRPDYAASAIPHRGNP
jgi:hypothetical protein